MKKTTMAKKTRQTRQTKPRRQSRQSKPMKQTKPVSEVSRPAKKRISFEVAAESGADVYLAGSFNGWNPKKKKLKEMSKGIYGANILLEKGQHEYKFVIDGNWHTDVECPEWSPNEHGTLNSIVNVD